MSLFQFLESLLYGRHVCGVWVRVKIINTERWLITACEPHSTHDEKNSPCGQQVQGEDGEESHTHICLVTAPGQVLASSSLQMHTGYGSARYRKLLFRHVNVH